MRGIRGALAIGEGTLSAAEFTMDRSVAGGGPVHESRSLLSAPSTPRLTRGNRSLSHRQRGRCHFIRREGLPLLPSGAEAPRPCGRTSCSGSIGAACCWMRSVPTWMMKGAKATGLRCMQCSQTTQHQGVPRRSCSRVGRGGSSFIRRGWRYSPRQSPLLRHQHGNATRGLLRKRSPCSVEQSL